MSLNLEAWLERIYGVDIERLSNGEISFPCPKCQKGDRHFQFNTKKSLGHCFRCGWRTTLTGLVAEIAGVSKHRAKEILRNHGIKVSRNDTYVKPKPSPFVPCELPPNTGWTTRAKEYLEERNVSDDMIDQFGLYYCGVGKYQGRIIMPVIMDDMVVSFQARTVFKDVKKRYENPPGVSMARCLYGYNLLPKSPSTLVLVEGPFDVIAVNSLPTYRSYKRSYYGLGCFGKSISEAQLDLLTTAPMPYLKIILAFDSDADITGMWRLLTLRFNRVSISIFTTGDPGDCKDLGRRLATASPNLEEAKWQATKRIFNLETLQYEKEYGL